MCSAISRPQCGSASIGTSMIEVKTSTVKADRIGNMNGELTNDK